MESFQEYREKAAKNLMAADHMLSVTYLLVKDPKLLLAVLDNLNSCLNNSVSAVLQFDRMFRRIPPYHDTFESTFNRFKEDSAKFYKISPDYLRLIAEIRELLQKHKESPVEFSRKEDFVICSEDYKTQTLSVPQLKEYVAMSKRFVEVVNQIVSQHDGLFK